MDWITATLISAVMLGCYDVSIKHSVRENAVLPVLFFANVCSAAIWLLLLIAPSVFPHTLPAALHVAPLDARQHTLLLLKSTIVAASWICSYFAMKHLPLSIAAPVRATGPLWTFMGALILLAERPSGLEVLGVVITLASFVGLSFAGQKEGIHFHRDKWMGFLFAGTLLGAVSGLYDKYLLGKLHFAASTVQCWFSIYLAVLFLPLAIGWKLRWWPRQQFHWRWSIVTMSLFLLMADFLYFDALRHPAALVTLVSSLRRASTLVAFAGSIYLFHEKNGLAKLPAVIGIVAGIVLTILG